MRRRWPRLLGVALMAMMVGLLAGWPSATASTLAATGTLSSGFQIQNIDTVPASVTVRFISADDPSKQYSYGPINIPAGGKQTVYPLPADIVPAGFRGSAVIESSAKVAAIANLLSTNPNMWGSYNGISETSTSVTLPLVMRKNSGWNTSVTVQNAGDAAADITLSFRKAGAAARDKVLRNVAPGAQVTVDQSSDTDADMKALGDKWVGSVVATSTQPLAAVVTEVYVGSTGQLMAYSGFGGGGPTIYAPLLQNNNNGWESGVQIQNMGSSVVSSAPLYVDGAIVYNFGPLNPGESKTFFPVRFSGKVSGGKVVGPAGSQLAGIVNQVGPGGQAMSYGMFSGGTQRVAAPLLMNNNSGWSTGFQVQNVGSSSTSVQLKVNGSPVGSPVNLAAGQSKTWYPIPGTGAGFIGSGEAVASSGGQLVGVVNQVCFGTASQCQAGDNSMTYEALNVQ